MPRDTLTLKVPITTAADNFHCFAEKIRLDVSSESSARQRIHMKNQALLSSKDKSEKLKSRLLHFLFGALGVKILVFEILTVDCTVAYLSCLAGLFQQQKPQHQLQSQTSCIWLWESCQLQPCTRSCEITVQ